MPTALDREGFKYFFYSNEHMPEHVHVKNGSARRALTSPMVCSWLSRRE